MSDFNVNANIKLVGDKLDITLSDGKVNIVFSVTPFSQVGTDLKTYLNLAGTLAEQFDFSK